MYRQFEEKGVLFIKERSLNAYPFLEICKGDLIHYMCPLENQVDFCVPELHEKKTSDDTEETVEHKDVDVKESVAGEPEQKSIPVIQEVVEESREVVETSAPLLESSQPSLGEEEGQSEDGDQGGKGSNESVGSGSSFEELDMELEEEKEEKTNEAEAEDHNGQQKLMMVGETIENREE
ncbi:testis-expressed sequence 264 protein-like [Labeo rohita]|uniref:Testis-expressed sequence 264 protein-like n=1 Tax=Labeo rohita TaxID=84645 RepID=A0A498L670_LABRO|nr:testis-expressed sequence 264 protein-like [Labeo rohita]